VKKQAVRSCALGGLLLVVALLSSGQGFGQQPRVERLVDDFPSSFSPDGRTIVFERWFSTQRFGVDTHPRAKRAVLLLMRADGSHKRVLRHVGVTFESDASFSHDGRSLLFVRDDRIFRMRRDGSGARPVRGDHLDQACPRFSPDGDKISLWRGQYGKSGGYFVMNTDGSGLRRIVAFGGAEVPWGCPSWFPDGKRLVFVKRFNLFVGSLGDRRIERITKGRNTLYRPAVSPDGRWIACDGNIAGRSGYGIIVMRADGTQMRRITTAANEIDNDAGASWSPDGRQIIFAGYRGRFRGAGVYVVNRDGSRLRRLSNFAR
jgi:Tol biopolymer transport system component